MNESALMGELLGVETLKVCFANGLPGLERHTEFFLSSVDQDNKVFYWLESADDASARLLLMDPFRIFPEYDFSLDEISEKELAVTKPEDVLVFTTVTIPGNIAEATTNLLGPIVINLKNSAAKQIILTGDKYSTKHRIYTKR